MSRFFLATAAVALVLPLVTRGSYRRLFGGRWYWGSFLLAGLGLQIAVGAFDAPETGTHQIGFGMLVASYVLVLGFTVRNALRKGMMVVTVGIAANFLVILLNQGMPVDVPGDWIATGGVTTTVKHHPQSPDDVLLGLSDVLVIRDLDEVISFGDLILAAGLLNVAFHASRTPRRRATSRRRERRLAGRLERRFEAVGPESGAGTDEVLPVDPYVIELDLTEEERGLTDAAASEHRPADETISDRPPKPPSPVVAGVIEELSVLRRAARDRHPSALAGTRAAPLVGRYAASATTADAGSVGSDAGDHDVLERLEHATVIHISGAGIQGLQREPSS